MYCSLNILWHCIFRDSNENWTFLSCGHCWVFQISWHIEFSNLTASYFTIWNSSTGIISPPLALFIVCFLRPTWLCIPRCLPLVITPSCLPESWRFFLYSTSVDSCHLFLIFSAYVRSIFLSFIVPIFAWNVPLVSLIFLKRSVIFPILLFSSICIDHWGSFSYLSLLFFGFLHSNTN